MRTTLTIFLAASCLGLLTALDAGSLIPPTSGILLVHRDAKLGTHLEYRSADLEHLYHEKSFHLSNRSFAIDQGDSDVVVIAERDSGIVTRAGRLIPDHTNRPSPRAITYDERDGLMAWIEGTSSSVFAISFLHAETGVYAATEDAPLNVDNCTWASLATQMRMEELNVIAIPLICDGVLHLVSIDLPIPPANANGRIPVKATSTAVLTSLMFNDAVAVASSPATGSIFIASSRGRDVCRIDRLELNLGATASREILLSEKTIFDCSSVGSEYSIRGLGYDNDHLYISAFTPGALRYFSTSIGRLSLASTTTTPLTVEDHLDVLLNRHYSVLANPELFSPGQLLIKRQVRGAHHIYWLDLLTGRISRWSFKHSPSEARPRVTIEAVDGHSCPSAIAIVPPVHIDQSPTLYWGDHGKNSIWTWPLSLDANWTHIERSGRRVAKTASQPSSLIVDAARRILYWSEAELATVVAFSLNSHSVLANLTYKLDSETTPTRIHSIAYSPVDDQIYATDTYPGHRRILAWKAPDPRQAHAQPSGGREAWRAWKVVDFVPQAIVADPYQPILYVSDANKPAIYVVLLNHDASISDHIESRFRPERHFHSLAAPNPLPAGQLPLNGSDSGPVPVSPPIANGHRPTDDEIASALLASVPNSDSFESPHPKLSQMLAASGWFGGVTAAVHAPHEGKPSAESLARPPPTIGAHSAFRGRVRTLNEETADGNPAVKLFYEQTDPNTEAIRQMWLNDGYLHWAEIRPMDNATGVVETTLRYRALLTTDSPLHKIDTHGSRLFNRLIGESYVVAAEFFEVHEALLPHDVWEAYDVSSATGYIASAFGAATIAVIGFFFCCKSEKLYDTLEEKSNLTDEPGREPSRETPSFSALMQT